MTAPVILIEVRPRRVADGAEEVVRLAGAGGSKPYFYDGEHWRAGVTGLPTTIAALDFNGDDIGTGSVPQALELRWAPASSADLALQAAYFWTDAALTMRIGPEGAPPPIELTGRVLDVAVDGDALVISTADPAADLKVPVLTDRFGGTGDLEGPAEWAGKIKRRAWGQVYNVKGEPIDQANNIYCFGDPTRPWQAIDAVRDKGAAAAALTTVGWQGTAAATLTALRAAEATDGGGVTAPSIACVKWWTEPAGDLCADIRGEIGADYVDTTPEIAARIVAARSTLAFAAGAVAAAAGVRPGVAGWLADDDGTLVSEVLDQLLGGVSLGWVLDENGAIAFREWAWGASAATVRSLQVNRRQSFKPVGTRKIGYRRNHNVMSRGDIAGIVLVDDIAGLGKGATADDLAELDAGAADKLTGIEAGATVGAPAGTNVAGVPAEDLIDNVDSEAIAHLIAIGNAEISRLRDRGLNFAGPAGETSYVLLTRETEKRETADTEFAQTFDLLGAVKPDRSAFVFNIASVFVGPDESMATRLDTIQAAIGDHQASIEHTDQVLADESGEVARALLRVTADGHILGWDAYNNGTTGIFTITADKFVIEDPDTGDQMFYIDEDGAKMHNVEVDKLAYSSLEPHFSGANNGLNPQHGYQVMPGGIMMQWGKVRQSISDEQSFNIVFPTPFKNAVVAVNATPFLYSFNNERDLWMQNVGTPTLTGCVFCTQAADHNGQNIDGFDWVAFGF